MRFPRHRSRDGGDLPVVYSRVISGWFDRRRGAALAAMIASAGVGGIGNPPSLQALVRAIGWRRACLVSGMASWRLEYLSWPASCGMPRGTVCRRVRTFRVVPSACCLDSPRRASICSRAPARSPRASSPRFGTGGEVDSSRIFSRVLRTPLAWDVDRRRLDGVRPRRGGWSGSDGASVRRHGIL
jgi:hypothetical protein